MENPLNEKCSVGSILTDLCKAFNSLSHDLLIAELHSYGISDSACSLIMSHK